MLDNNGLDFTAAVSAKIYEDIDGALMEIGETDDIITGWDDGIFMDNFDCYWLSLPDGTNLATYIADYGEGYTVYTSPVLLNGERTNLRIRQYSDYTLVMEGAWDGIDENGFASREVRKIKPGDKIAPVYYFEEGYYIEMSEFAYKWKKGDGIEYNYLDPGDYYYRFDIYDVYGGCYSTDFTVFSVDEDGNKTFGKA